MRNYEFHLDKRSKTASIYTELVYNLEREEDFNIIFSIAELFDRDNVYAELSVRHGDNHVDDLLDTIECVYIKPGKRYDTAGLRMDGMSLKDILRFAYSHGASIYFAEDAVWERLRSQKYVHGFDGYGVRFDIGDGDGTSVTFSTEKYDACEIKAKIGEILKQYGNEHGLFSFLRRRKRS